MSPPKGRKGAMPEQKLQALQKLVAAELGIEQSALTRDHLEQAFHFGEGPIPSQRICQAATKDNVSLRNFLKMWRELFVASLEPKFLAEGWSVDTGLDDG